MNRMNDKKSYTLKKKSVLPHVKYRADCISNILSGFQIRGNNILEYIIYVNKKRMGKKYSVFFFYLYVFACQHVIIYIGKE